MKKLFIGLGIAAMVMGMAAGANAYVIQAVTNDGIGTGGYGMATITMNSATTPKAINMVANPGTSSEISVWDGVTANQRLSTYFTASEPTVWNLKLYVADAFPTADKGTDITGVLLKMWAPSIAGADSTKDYALKAGNTVLWTGKFFSTASTSAAVAPISYAFNFSDNWGDLRGKTVDLTFGAAVPEPGSMVAMLSGLAGLVGFGIRRRK